MNVPYFQVEDSRDFSSHLKFSTNMLSGTSQTGSNCITLSTANRLESSINSKDINAIDHKDDRRIQDILLLASFNHPNIVKFIGVSVDRENCKLLASG